MIIILFVLSIIGFITIVYGSIKDNDLLLIVGIILLFTFSLCMGIQIEKDSNKYKEVEDTELCEQVYNQLSFEDSVYNYILELNIKHPDIVLRQARIESGNFQSKIFKENNNMFGFKQAYKRPNTQIGMNRSYAVYENWKECILDYALYQTYSAKNLNEEDYIKFLGNNFAADSVYSNKLK